MTETREEEWKTYTIRVKKDHEWPHHGSDIEFNGCRYKRADLAEKPAPDDKPDQFCKACEGHGVVATTKSDLDGNYIEQECPVCFPAAPDDAEVREAIESLNVFCADLREEKTILALKTKHHCFNITGYEKLVGYIQTIIRAAENSVKQNHNDHTQPVLQPVGELQEAIDRALGKVEYEIKPFSWYQLQKEDLDIIIRAAEEATALQHILNESIKNCDELCDEVNKLRSAQSQNKNTADCHMKGAACCGLTNMGDADTREDSAVKLQTSPATPCQSCAGLVSTMKEVIRDCSHYVPTPPWEIAYKLNQALSEHSKNGEGK